MTGTAVEEIRSGGLMYFVWMLRLLKQMSFWKDHFLLRIAVLRTTEGVSQYQKGEEWT